jgi:ferritin-like metal-binding protein YciE
MIAAAQKVGHYEIPCYGTVRTWAFCAEKMRPSNFSRKPWMKKEAYAKLTELAGNMVNPVAEGNEQEKAAAAKLVVVDLDFTTGEGARGFPI